LPFIQCHHTRGRALWGGWRKPWRRESFAVAAGDCAIAADANSKIKQARFMPEIVHRNVRGTTRAPLFLLRMFCCYKLIWTRLALGCHAAGAPAATPASALRIILAEGIPVRANDFSQSAVDGPRMLPSM